MRYEIYARFVIVVFSIVCYNFSIMADAAIAGSLAGAVSMFMTFPLEQLRTLRQAGQPIPRNFFDFFRGCRAVLETVAISNFLYFYLQEATLNFQVPMVAASTLAAVGNTILTEPLWKANTSLKLGSKSSQVSVLTELRRAVNKEGLLHQWRGTGVSLWLVGNPVIQFTAYEWLKRQIMIRRRGKPLSDVEIFMIGAASKALATVMTYPLQVAQTRLRNASKEYKGTVDCLNKIYDKDGVSGLFAGISSKLAQTVLTAALMLLIYERIRRQISLIRKSI